MNIYVDPMVIIWVLVAILIIVGIALLVQIIRFFKQLMDRTKEVEVTIQKANDLIDQTNHLIVQTTEFTERVNNSYKQVNKIVDYATTGITNFVVSKLDKDE